MTGHAFGYAIATAGRPGGRVRHTGRALAPPGRACVFARRHAGKREQLRTLGGKERAQKWLARRVSRRSVRIDHGCKSRSSQPRFERSASTSARWRCWAARMTSTRWCSRARICSAMTSIRIRRQSPTTWLPNRSLALSVDHAGRRGDRSAVPGHARAADAGIDRSQVAAEFEEHAAAELQHAEWAAERINQWAASRTSTRQP